jgi:putative transposase
MTRLARIVVPHAPHHVTQRGNRREPIFFEEGDQDVYMDLLAEQALKARLEIWAYCLMPNHVHLIAVPRDDLGLGRAVGETHRRYTNFVNARGRWTGHLFQRRFASVVMDDAHLIAGVRYVSLNPVRAKLVPQAEDWPWSSVRAHLAGSDDGLVIVKPVLDRVGDFAKLLQPDSQDEAAFSAIRLSEGSGRPLANAAFVADLERLLRRPIARRSPGRKAKLQIPSQDDLPFGE